MAGEGQKRKKNCCTENAMWNIFPQRGLIDHQSWNGNLKITAWNFAPGGKLIDGRPHGETGWKNACGTPTTKQVTRMKIVLVQCVTVVLKVVVFSPSALVT